MTTFCECETPDYSDVFVAVGTPGNIVDFRVCGRCEHPIRGTAATHVDVDDGDE